MNYTKETKNTYDKYAKEFEQKSKFYIVKYMEKDFRLFLKSLKWDNILDIWSWPWRDSVKFKENWLKPICIDISDSMVELCKQKWLEAYQMDLEKLIFENNSFDWIWAHTSIVHIPKSKIENVLNKISEILKKDWIFYIWMKEWTFEWFKKWFNSDNRRYFSYYTREEMEKLLSCNFDIIHFSRVETPSWKNYINFLYKNKL